jgi:hypothetical protein
MKLILSKEEWMELLKEKLRDDVLDGSTITKLELSNPYDNNEVHIEFHPETAEECQRRSNMYEPLPNRQLAVEEVVPIYFDPKPSPELFKSDAEAAKAFSGIPSEPINTDDEVPL